MVEQGCLLSSYTAKSCVVGSNPTLSASLTPPFSVPSFQA